MLPNKSWKAGFTGRGSASLKHARCLAWITSSHSSILAWRIPWTEEPGGLYSPRGRKGSDTTEWLHFRLRLMEKNQGINSTGKCWIPGTGFFPSLHMSIHLETLSRDHGASVLEFLIQEVWDRAQVSAFLTSSQVMLMLLVQGPQFENTCSYGHSINYINLSQKEQGRRSP